MKKANCTLAQTFARRALRERVGALKRNVRAAAAHDVEGIHDMRVASRRLRAVLADHASNYRKKFLKPLRRQVKSITRGLGSARELDVTIQLLKEWRKQLPKSLQPAVSAVQRRLRILRDAESQRVGESCNIARSPGFRDAYTLISENTKLPKHCFLNEVDSRIQERFTVLAIAFDKWQRTALDQDLHAVRIAFKKFRYSCEICQPLYGDSMEQLISHLKDAQETLGQWNDQRVLRDHIIASSADLPRYSQDLAKIVSRIDARTSRLLTAFNKVGTRWIGPENRSKMINALGKPTVACCVSKHKNE